MSLINQLKNWYPLSSSVDDSIGGNNGTNTGVTFVADGAITVADFDGIADRFTAPNQVSDPFSVENTTVSLWLKTTASGASAVAVGSHYTSGGATNPLYALYITAAGLPWLLIRSNGGTLVQATATTAINDGNWHNVVFTRSTTQIEVFVDGNSEASGAFVGGGTLNNNNVTGVGCWVSVPPATNVATFYAGKMSDLATWNRVLSGPEISQIEAAGPAGFAGLLPGPVSLRNIFGTVVHDVPDGTTPVELRQTFGTVVHDVPAGTTPVELRQTFATVASQVPPFSVYAADITGTIAASSMFSASVSGEWSSVPKTYPEVGFAWEFVSTPSGSQIAKIPPLPDNSSPSGWTDMSDNTTLFHFNEDLNWSDPTTLNNITGSSALLNVGIWEGTFISGSDPKISTSSLGDYRGVEFFGNNKVVTSLTASQLGIDGAKAKTIMLWAKIDESAPNDDNYIFSIGDETNKGMLGLRKINKNAFLPPGTPDQGNAQRFESYTGFDGYGQPDFFVPNTNQWRHWAVTYESGSSELVWYVDGEVVFVDPILSGNHSSPTSRTILNLSDTSVHVGGYSPEGSSNTYSFTGSLSEFAIFSSSLPQSQIRGIYNKQKSTGFYQDTWDKLPDSSAVTDWVDMSDNVILYHLDEVESTTQIGSVGLIDSFSDGWHGSNWISVLVNSMVVVNSATLAAGGGPEWYDFSAEDGDSVEIIFSSLGSGSPHWGSECSFSLNSGSAGSGVTFYTSPLFPVPPVTPYSFTANGFLTGTLASTIQDSSGQGNDGSSVLGYATASAGPFSGSTAWSGSGANQISIGNLSITGSSGLSFSTWLKPTKNLTDEKFYVFDFTNGSNQDISLRKDIGAYGSGKYQNVVFEIGAGSVQSRAMFDQITGSIGGVPLESGWVHWVATADGAGSMSLYKDGELINSASGQGTIPDSIRDTNYVGIKSDLDSAWRYDGELSEFAMWERELSAYEVQKIYQHQFSGSSVYNNYGVDFYSNSASFLPDVEGDYVTKVTAYGSTAFDYATASIGISDCAGVVGGSAYTNSCGFCVEGTTGLPATYGQIECWDGSWICTASVPPAVTGTCPPESPLPCIESGSSNPRLILGRGLVINNYINLSAGRSRRVNQVPFKLGIKDRLGLRFSDTISTTSGSVPTYCTGS
jgi:hypothetical protein